jgi:hypothetical protein
MAVDVVNGITVHPAAHMFPMMGPDELAELAQSIYEHGLQSPIVMFGDVLVDGRNRLEACRIAKVKPRFAELPKDADVLAYIADANLQRRNLTKGQKAMAMAMMYPDALNVGRAGSKNGSATEPFSKSRLSYARAVLHHSRSLAESVLNGVTPLDAALAEVKGWQQAEQSDEAKLGRLRAAAPDLADQVNEERLRLDEAVAAMQARQQRLRQLCDDGRQAVVNIAGEFTAHVSSIASAIENGEPLALTDKQWEQLEASWGLLQKLMAR